MGQLSIECKGVKNFDPKKFDWVDLNGNGASGQTEVTYDGKIADDGTYNCYLSLRELTSGLHKEREPQFIGYPLSDAARAIVTESDAVRQFTSVVVHTRKECVLGICRYHVTINGTFKGERHTFKTKGPGQTDRVIDVLAQMSGMTKSVERL